ncbi:2-succinyl-5-enolpyruvyl-6-hydroxy-3-cyclohexene-1-carboxylic-acid synthase [Thiolapillus brandeum]|uniref:2-succinyl-5-enolpyruvyl-6-hydroxy-3-cyclohexene-1-carboxylate synthase n=1 Tax=Thiolapillus brandeum TaxID=1076588 RepID=A0A7U6JHU5_9GAMM|nr:2-succinyl-5-enolpyruvyl-6-hydroxy-3-cyclohexene-1-carboxylic-acid synthase [Thiolapillus brandeum]BAO43570.1 2-succinyl-5-enolpyruvyl-6-hydroxy-3-cyclohexene-1-carboxylic-acid synthase [Thiolapillus brandeum]
MLKDPAKINLEASLALLDGLVGAGLERLVYSPGSRNTPLTLAAIRHAQVDECPAVDERSAAWLALGMARVSRRPVALVCTSGTAVANWHPAVVEADRQGIPLVLISADRPWELQQCAANQSIDQEGLFGRHVRAFHPLSPPDGLSDSIRRLRALGRQLLRESLGVDPGPVHLNFPFREPLVPLEPPGVSPAVTVEPLYSPVPALAPGELALLARQLKQGNGVIVCGPGDPLPEVLRLGEACGAPVLADPLSGLRFTGSRETDPLAGYDLFLRDQALARNLQPDWILHFGGLPVSRSLQNWLAGQTQARYWWVNPAGRTLDLPGASVETLPVSPDWLSQALPAMLPAGKSRDWCQAWQQQERRVRRLLEQVSPPLEVQVLRRLVDQLPDDSLLFLANSLPVRFFDACSGIRHTNVAVYGNRGASGIDGNLSTLAGLTRAWHGSGLAVGIVGDLAFFHDLNALSLCRQQDILLLLFNNGGGGIFDYLPQVGLAEHEQGWRTPVPLAYEHLAAAFGIPYQRLEQVEDMESVLTGLLPEKGCRLLEIVIDAEVSRQQYQEFTNQFTEN